jgi:CubicO group peptidase (beta-lactamase class C family)
MAKRGLFIGTVLVGRDDKILLSKGYGLANSAWHVPNDPGTRFQLASVTKQFTAAAVLRLVDQGKVHLDDPVSKYITDAPSTWSTIKVRNLLNQTSGIFNFTDAEDFGLAKTQSLPPQAIYQRFRDKPLGFPAGTAYNYSNSNYTLLAMLIEAVTGKSFSENLRIELFAPLGMVNSGVARSDEIITRLANGYRLDGNTLRPAHLSDLSWTFGAGNLYSTTGDLLKWQRALHSGKVLSASSFKEMTTPVYGNYAMGLTVDTSTGKPIYSHSGGNDGVSTWLRYEQATQLTVVVLGNIEGAASQMLAGKLSAVASGIPVVLPEERKTVTLSSVALARIEGAYQIAPDNIAWVVMRNDSLWIRIPHQPWTRLVPQSGSVFYAPELDMEFRFNSDDSANTIVMKVPDITNNRPWVSVKLDPPRLTAQPVFVRGSMNQWGAKDQFALGSNGLFQVSIIVPAGPQEFKIASADWGAIDLGGKSPMAPIEGHGSMPLVFSGDNVPMKLSKPSKCTFTLDSRDIVMPILAVSCEAVDK